LTNPTQLESIVNSIVTGQHILAHAQGSKNITFEDLFLIKLYTFAQWVQCVRYCGVKLEAATGQAPAGQDAKKLADVMKTPCSQCQLQSSWDSWFVRFNGDTRGPGTLADRWKQQSKKVVSSLEKVNRKTCSFFRGLDLTIEKCLRPLPSPLNATFGLHLVQHRVHRGGCRGGRCRQ
jgi:hypothetical protein